MRTLLFFIGLLILFPLNICIFYYIFKGWQHFKNTAIDEYKQNYFAQQVQKYHQSLGNDPINNKVQENHVK